MTTTTTLTIEALGHRGEGMARHNGETVFVPLTLAGETVEAEVSGKRGRLLFIEKPSPDRIDPFCPHFGRCGGCQLQHLAPPAYAAFKSGLAQTALERAGLTADIEPLVLAHGMGRRRATLHFDGRRAGFMGLRSHHIHDLDLCPVLTPGLANAPQIARRLGSAVGPCDIALTETGMGIDVAIRAKKARPTAALTRAAQGLGLARIALNGEVVLNFETPYITMGPANVALPPASFLQATKLAQEVLADYVLDAAKSAKAVADLFCGIGPFALRLAANGPVYAADSDGPAIDALTSAARNTSGLKTITADRRDLFSDPLGTYELNRFDCVVLDPPRAGAQAQIAELAGAKVGRIIYVSCDPHSFARDAATLVAAGYRMGPVTPIDQFAFSAHLELAATFTR